MRILKEGLSDHRRALSIVAAAAMQIFCTGSAGQDAVQPGTWSPSGVALTLRTQIETASGEYQAIDVIDFWMNRTGAPGERIVWFARREKLDDPAAPIEITSSQTCPDVFEVIAGLKFIDPPQPDLMMEAPSEPQPLLATRKDGADYRISYRAGGTQRVQIRSLGTQHYAWADHTRNRLRHCWASGWRIERNQAGTMASGSRPED